MILDWRLAIFFASRGLDWGGGGGEVVGGFGVEVGGGFGFGIGLLVLGGEGGDEDMAMGIGRRLEERLFGVRV